MRQSAMSVGWCRSSGILLICSAVLASGCSFALVQGPPADYATRDYFYCTESSVAPWADFAAAGMVLYWAVDVFANSDVGEGKGKILLFSGTATGLPVVAGITGLRRIQACREAQGALARRVRPPRPLND